MRVSYAIVFVRDMKRSTAFYRDVLGMTLRFESPHWTEFDTGGATFALHLADAGAAASGADDPMHVPAARCRPGLEVADLDAFHARMVEHGVRCTNVCPGGVATDFALAEGYGRTPDVLPGMMTAEDVAEVVLFCLTRPRSHRILETALRPMTEQSWG